MMDSKTVFKLRREAKELNSINKVNKLNEALQISFNLYKSAPSDEWHQKAFAWILIDLCDYYVSINDLNQGIKFFNQLNSIQFDYLDEWIEKKKTLLKPKIDSNYAEINRAEQLSKNGNHKEAIDIFSKLIKENRLYEIHHEIYGWAIYRYIKNSEKELTLIKVKEFLWAYMKLHNERPSLLHSIILRFAMSYSKDHSDFNFYTFFKKWNPENLRDDDKLKQCYNKKESDSLLSQILKTLIEGKYNIDVEYLVTKIEIDIFDADLNRQRILDLLREPFFWQIFNAKKENRLSNLWELFTKYNLQFSTFKKSRFHSEILSLAERYMQEDNEWRFLKFFERWDPINNFMDEDWKEVKEGDNTYKPLAVKCLKKSFKIIKKNNYNDNVDYLIDLYKKASSKFPQDKWLKRDQALLLISQNEFQQAIEIYKSLILNLGDQWYIWHEFSTCFEENEDLKIAMLSKAIQVEKNEDFLGEIHLELARTLIRSNLFENAIIELSTYKKHRDKKCWKLSEIYSDLLFKTTDYSTSLRNNKELYKQYIPIAEEYAYQDINWSEFVLVDIWKNDKNKERCNFNNGKGIEFSIDKQRFKNLETAQIGNIYEFKVHLEKKEIEQQTNDMDFMFQYPTPKIGYKYIPLLSNLSKKHDWDILEDVFAVIYFINIDKETIHAITSQNEEIFFKEDVKIYNINDFIQGKKLISKKKEHTRIELKNIIKIEKSKGVSKFQKVIAVVDNVNQEKNLFHFVVDSTIQGIVWFSETDLRPNEGDFLEMYIVKKTDTKQNKIIYKALEIKETTATNDKLLKTIQGSLELKFKSGGYTKEFHELERDKIFDVQPDFAFISDCYVPKYLLDKYSIKTNCMVTAKAIFSGEKWKVIDLTK